MLNSPMTFLKRTGILDHVPGSADLYQEGVHHAHAQPLDETAAGELAQDAWPDLSPGKKCVEGTEIPL